MEEKEKLSALLHDVVAETEILSRIEKVTVTVCEEQQIATGDKSEL